MRKPKIPVELFQILKDDARKVLHSICQQIWKTAVVTGLEMVSFHSNSKEEQCQKCSHYCTIVLVSHASKVMLKILKARLQQYVNQELPDVKAEFRRERETRDQTANIQWIIEKVREFQKNIYFCFTDYAKALTVWITTNCGKIFKRW